MAGGVPARDDADGREALRRALYRPGSGPEDVAAYRRAGGRTRRAVLLTGLVAAAAGGAVLLAQARPGAPATAPARLPLSADDRGELAHNLARGRPAGLRTVLLSRPYPARLPRLGELGVEEWIGSGTRTVALPTVAQRARVGLVTVLAVLEADGTVAWTVRRGGAVVRAVEWRQPAGAVSLKTLRVTRGAVPDRLSVTGPPGVRWGAAVILSDPDR